LTLQKEEEQKKQKKVYNIKFSVNSLCPCGNGNKYKKCCQPFHKGKLPKTALELMKSRYSAFALSNGKYIIHTTHTNNPDYTIDTTKWLQDIQNFVTSCEFKNLEVIEFTSLENEAFVTFKATIFCNKEDCSFTEKSRFIKENNKWFYISGVFL